MFLPTFLRLLSRYGFFNHHGNIFEQLPHHTFLSYFLIDVFPPPVYQISPLPARCRRSRGVKSANQVKTPLSGTTGWTRNPPTAGPTALWFPKRDFVCPLFSHSAGSLFLFNFSYSRIFQIHLSFTVQPPKTCPNFEPSPDLERFGRKTAQLHTLFGKGA